MHIYILHHMSNPTAPPHKVRLKWIFLVIIIMLFFVLFCFILIDW